MGNLDLVYIFNKRFGIIVRGREYDKQPDAIHIALKQFQAEAQASVDAWYEAKKRDPSSVEEHYRPEDELEINSIECYMLHN